MRAVLLSLAALAAVACAAVAQPPDTAYSPTISPSAPAVSATSLTTPTPTPTPRPSSGSLAEPPVPVAPTTTPPADACCSLAPTPVPDETLAESDAFWDHWAVYPHFEPPFLASSLAENIDQAHLVVRGHIVDIYVGEEYERSDPDLSPIQAVAFITVAISEVLKGSPVSLVPGYLEVGVGITPSDRSQVEALRTALPQHDALWFLMHELTLGPRPPGYDSELAPYAYFGKNDLQGVIRGIDGEVRVIKPEWIEEFGSDFFPLPLEGTSFDDLIEQLRELAPTNPEDLRPTSS